VPPGDIRPGDIYFVTIDPNQTVGSEQHSRRPFIIVSRFLLNQRSTIVSGIPLTTTRAEETSHPPHRIRIPANEIVRAVTFVGEIKNSVALTDQVRVLSKARLENKMGSLSDTALAAVGLGLVYLFDL
jgi:mRNA interferase MazF